MKMAKRAVSSQVARQASPVPMGLGGMFGQPAPTR